MRHYCGRVATQADRPPASMGGMTTPSAALEALVIRVLGRPALRHFVFEFTPDEQGRDVFELSSRGAQVCIRGSSGPALAMGLNTYLKEVAGLHHSWDGARLALPDPPPPVVSMNCSVTIRP